MSKKMWAGRFEKATDKEVNDYNSSLPLTAVCTDRISGARCSFSDACASGCYIEERR